ncbi:MAG: 4-(cytidine 5'-diphospho)-2-C-methyl-D-erythritol kinase [Candidatus Limnocylindrales bacterium]
MTRFEADAHAKINLALAITGRRDDGYHELRSVFLRLALHDRLEVEPVPGAPADHLEVEGEQVAVGDNLVLRAATHLRAAIDPSLPSLRFGLRKRIPTAAGLGGGSSDAAAAIDLALAAWGVRLHPAERLGAALRVGADVPFFSAGHPASLVEGIGERVSPLPSTEPAAGILLVTPSARLSTADVFAEYDRAPSAGALERVDEVVALLREGVDGMMLAASTAVLRDANDLWPPAARLLPELAATRDLVSRTIGRAVLLTGSGPTLVAVYPSESAATRAAAALGASSAPELEGATIISTSTLGRGEDS